jgi:hypothetical protein
MNISQLFPKNELHLIVRKIVISAHSRYIITFVFICTLCLYLSKYVVGSVIAGSIFEIGSTGISSLGGHSERRTQCVNRFVAEYGQMPLVSTSVKAVDSRNIWFW